MKVEARDSGQTTGVRTFLIADVRGYTRFTHEHGDAEAARLAKKFADLARDAVEARRGRVIELRGDEALAVFESTAQAVRAALEFQGTCLEETAEDPSLPLTVGIGIDVGEAIPVEDGFRGVALNTAARLCSQAVAGQVLVTRAVADLAGNVQEVQFEERGAAELKGFDKPVDLVEPVPLGGPAWQLAETRDEVSAPLPPELDSFTPLVDREREMHWLRGTWRQAKRGRGRVLFVSGPSQIGKTRLAAALAAEVTDGGGRVRYAGPGGTAAAAAMSAIREAVGASNPTLVILDDLDISGEEAAGELAEAENAIGSRPVVVLALVKEPEAGPTLTRVVEKADEFGDGHLRLGPLELIGVQEIAQLYVGDEVQDVPIESMARASGGVPGRVHEVVSEWARDEAGRRLTAAAEWLAEGRGRRSAGLEFANNVIGLKLGRLYGAERDVAAEYECPYKGLASFQETDASYFFGRERLVGELAARTVQVGLLGVVGASGSGKSSVVAAGLLPSLRAGLLPGSERWESVVFRPGEHPMAELNRALSRGAAGSPVGNTFEAAIDGVGPGGRLVVAVDQFEEVFTLCTDDDERDTFIDTVTRAAMSSPERVAFVLTIRDDFYGRCAPYRELSDLVNANHVLVPPMTNDELRRAIELPGRRIGLRIEAALADALIEEVAEEPGGLPLLSAALVELWQSREDGWLRMDAYERTGGVRGAVARLAEASYQQLGPAEREVARRIFLRLAGIGDGDLVTRRRVQLSEFDVETDPVAAEVLARFTEDRLLTMSDSTVEVAHEALLREWPRLRGWLEEDAQGHQLRQHLTQTAKQWEASGRDPSEVYRGARLSTALDWASARGPDLNQLERDFLAESRQASEHEAERQRRTNRRLRGFLVGTAVFLVVALVAGALALVQRGRARGEAERAEREARIASARELASAAVANLDVDPERSILLALEAVDATWDANRTAVPEAEEALHRALQESRVALTVPQGHGLAVSADGSRFGTTGQDDSATVWETRTGKRLLGLRLPAGRPGVINAIAFSPEGKLLATTVSDGTVLLWDGATGRHLRLLQGHRGPALSPAFSPDGKLLATTSEDGTVRLWNVAAGTEVQVLKGPPGESFYRQETLLRPAFSPDGSRLTSGGWPSTPVWDVATGKIAVLLPGSGGFESETAAAAFSPDGRRILTGNYKGVAQIWDASSGKPRTTFSGHVGELLTVAFSPDGDHIATAASDATARIWNTATGEHILTLAGHNVGIQEVMFTPDGDRLLTGGADGTARVWDITPTGGRDWLTVPGPSLRLGGVSFSPDGRSVAVPEQFTGVTIRDVETGAKIRTLKGYDATITSMAFTPDGSRLAAGSGSGQGDPRADRTVAVWDVETGDVVMTLTGHGDQTSAVAVSPDGRRFATGSYDGTIRVWDAATGDEQHKLEIGASSYAVAFSPDGRFLVSGNDAEKVLTIWAGDSLEPLGELRGHADIIQDVAFLSDRKVVTASWDGTAKVWDLESRRELTTLRGHSGPVVGVAVSPDKTRIATASIDGTTKLWDARTGREVLTLFGHVRIVHSVDISSDGRLLATASGDGTVALHLLAIEELRRLARERVTRALTDDECRQYLHVPKCPAGGPGRVSQRAAASPQQAGGRTVSVFLKDYSVSVDPASVPAGKVTFKIKVEPLKRGRAPFEGIHSFSVLRTDLPHDQLPVTGGHARTLDPRIEVVAADAPSLKERYLEAELKPGRYVLICNTADHYPRGMHTGFTVTG
jgi:WD40 repeat protein/class 3 adenylate cyclase